MGYILNLWKVIVMGWFPDWEQNFGYTDGFVQGLDLMNGDDIGSILVNLPNMQLPDIVYFVGSVVICGLLIVALFLLFKWMFTLVWRLFKID